LLNATPADVGKNVDTKRCPGSVELVDSGLAKEDTGGRVRTEFGRSALIAGAGAFGGRFLAIP
jgi:hypothetical protein